MTSVQEERYVQLCMRRSLCNLSQLQIPENYTVRHYKPGDGVFWEKIINSAFERENMNFNNTMRNDGSFRDERVIFVCHGDRPAATASAWYKPEWGLNNGYLHMVGTDPEYSGKGLGLTVSLAALHVMADEGRDDVILLTDDFRIPAIKTYLKLGFRPVPIHLNQKQRWIDIFKKLDRLELIEKFRGDLEGPLFDDTEPRPDLDSPEKYPVANRWHRDRPHRLGTGLTDALGDESIYKSSDLGMTAVNPTAMKASSTGPLKISFTNGNMILPKGTKVTFYLNGQGTLSKDTMLRTNGKEAAESIKAECKSNCKVEGLSLGFVITDGYLKENEKVDIYVENFIRTSVAGRYEIKTIIKISEDEPSKRLPEPAVVTIEPCEFDHLDIFIPCTYEIKTDVKAHLSLRDKYDNRIGYNGEISVIHGSESKKSYFRDGYAEEKFRFTSGNTEVVKAFFNDIVYESNPSVCCNEEKLFLGDLHVHDFLSAAHGDSRLVYEWGRDDKALDFLSVSVQNHGWLSNEKWAIAKYMNESYLHEGEFVTFLACEWQHSGYGDKIIHFLGGDQPYFTADDRRTNTVEKLYESVESSDAFIVSHHSAYKQRLWCGGTDYSKVNDKTERLIELWSMHGSSEGFDMRDRPLKNMDQNNTVYEALKKGLRLGFSGGSDTHSGRPGGSVKEPRPYWGGLTAVWAEKKTRRSIFKALYERRTYALTDSRIVLKFRVNGACMGSKIQVSDEAEITAEVWSPSEMDKIYIMKNTEVLTEYTVTGRKAEIDMRDRPSKGDFYFCRVVLEDGNLAVCSPVWVN